MDETPGNLASGQIGGAAARRLSAAGDLPVSLLVYLVTVRIDVVLRGADGVQEFQILRRQSQIGDPEIVRKLCLVACSDEDGRDHRPFCQPCQRHLCQRAVVPLGDLPDGFDDGPGPFLGVARGAGLHAPLGLYAQPAGAVRHLVAPILGAEPAATQRRPRQKADAGIECCRHDLEFDVADQQIVLGRQGDRRAEPGGLRDIDGLGELPPQKVAKPVVADLARADPLSSKR